jgi:hypothetical protein
MPLSSSSAPDYTAPTREHGLCPSLKFSAIDRVVVLGTPMPYKFSGAWETLMAAFDFQIGPHGARVTAAREPLCPGCLSDGEVDANIKRLTDDLDAVAKRMKRAVRDQNKRPLDLEIASRSPRLETPLFVLALVPIN